MSSLHLVIFKAQLHTAANRNHTQKSSNFNKRKRRAVDSEGKCEETELLPITKIAQLNTTGTSPPFICPLTLTLGSNSDEQAMTIRVSTGASRISAVYTTRCLLL